MVTRSAGEVDCQIRVVRERMDTFSELLDELMQCQAWDGWKGHSLGPDGMKGQKIFMECWMICDLQRERFLIF